VSQIVSILTSRATFLWLLRIFLLASATLLGVVVGVAPARGQSATQLAFSITPSVAGQAQTVTLSAEVTAATAGQIPAGQVEFIELSPVSAVLATPTLDSAGHVSLALSGMAMGSYLITAVYEGAPGFAPATLPVSDALTLSIAQDDYSPTLSATSLSVASGKTGQLGLKLSSLGSFAGAVTPTCTGLPQYATCSFTPAAANLTLGGAASVVLTVNTDAIPATAGLGSAPASTGLDDLARYGMLALLSVLALGSLPRRRRAMHLVVLAAWMLPLAGCSGLQPGSTAPGSYTIQVVTQANGSTVTHSSPFLLVVTP
jgi:hypothetical protein